MSSLDAVPERIAQYRILRALGSGGMAKVFLAEDERLQRQVALKLLARHATDSLATKARFLHEARSAARLDHPNVCAIYEVGEAPEGYFIAMQLVEGESLAARMSRRRLELGEALDIAIQVLDALAEAHAKGIIHRDIKPGNIMLTARDQVKVLDFGLAKRTLPDGDTEHQSLTLSGMVVGTIPYMSPEQLKSEPVDGRSDLFSTGTMLYEMATGSRPFQAKSGAEVMSAILKEVPPLLKGSEDLPSGEMLPALRRVLRHALEKDPQRRYPTAAAFSGELAALRQGLTDSSEDLTSARPSSGASGMVTSVLRSSKALRRHQGLRWSLVTLLAILTLGATAWFALPGLLRPRQGLESIAVLPFVTAPGDTEAELLAEGIVDQLIRDLARRPNLKVIARSSVAKYKGADLDLKSVAKSLGVKAVLVGRFALRGDRREVSAELVDPADLRQLWSDKFSVRSKEMPELQLRIMQGLTVGTGLPPPGSRAATSNKKVNPEAFELYLRGKQAIEKMTLADIKMGFGFLDEALRLDPYFPEAHLQKAFGYMVMSQRFMTTAETFPKMQEEANHTIEKDPGSGEAHALLGLAAAVNLHDSERAENEFQEAVRLSPGSARVRQIYGYFLCAQGRHLEAARETERALDLDPLSTGVLASAALTASFARDWSRAERALNKALAMDPTLTFPKIQSIRMAIWRGQFSFAERSIKTLPDQLPLVKAMKGILIGRRGGLDEARAIAAEFLSSGGDINSRSPYLAAMIFAELNDTKQAISALKLSIAEREEAAIFMGTDPSLDNLRNLTEFQQLSSIAKGMAGSKGN